MPETRNGTGKGEKKGMETATATVRREISAILSDELLSHGMANVIGLEAVRARTGDRWEKSCATVYSRLEAILQRKLGPSDFFSRLNEAAYLVTMPEVEREEANICCLSIALELHVGLFGACDLGEVSLSTARLAGEDAIELEAIDPAEIAALARKSGLHEMLASLSITEERLSMAAASSDSDQASSHVFLPLWDARKEAVIGYRCVPIAPEAAADNPASVQLQARTELKRVLATLMHATGTLSRHLARGERFLVGVPMTYEVLSCPLTRMEIAAACRDLPAELRAYLLFEIVDVPKGVPNSKLSDLVTTLRPFCKALIVHTPFRNRTTGAHASTPMQALALELPGLRAQAAETRVEIERVREEAKRLGCISLVTNVADPEMFRFAVSRGVNLFSGPLIGKQIEPGPMHRLRADDIAPPDLAVNAEALRLSA